MFTGPRRSAVYFIALDAFLRSVLGDEVARFYQIIIGDSQAVGKVCSRIYAA
ncbi:MAG: hypothetical protein QF515_06595 [Pseudomonadales bacterium]|nr:hypothetical protein [Pseudomonadales bacterium]MDP6826767.1 hypothetical protein [Pseudomonadales bacterium]